MFEIKAKTQFSKRGTAVFVFFGMVSCFRKFGCERKARLAAARGHRVQAELCVGSFVCFKWRNLQIFISKIKIFISKITYR